MKLKREVVKANQIEFYSVENVRMHAVVIDCLAAGKLPLNLVDNGVLGKLLKEACPG